MSELVIACLSQKGGVGKSTLSRLIARTYASAGWSVKIADFNTKQLTSVDWVGLRMKMGLEPVIHAEPYASPKNFKREAYDLIVADGKPDSDDSSLAIARVAQLIVIPTGLSTDDLKPQILFANELVQKGVPRDRIMIVLNKVTESEASVQEVRQILRSTGYEIATNDLTAKTGYQKAQDAGRSVAETTFPTLNERADGLASEIVTRMNELSEKAA